MCLSALIQKMTCLSGKFPASMLLACFILNIYTLVCLLNPYLFLFYLDVMDGPDWMRPGACRITNPDSGFRHEFWCTVAGSCRSHATETVASNGVHPFHLTLLSVLSYKPRTEFGWCPRMFFLAGTCPLDPGQ